MSDVLRTVGMKLSSRDDVTLDLNWKVDIS